MRRRVVDAFEQRELDDQRSHADMRQLAEECAQLQRKLNASEAVARDAIEQLHVSEERARVGSRQVAELTRQLAESEVVAVRLQQVASELSAHFTHLAPQIQAAVAAT